MLAYAIGVRSHPRFAACIEKRIEKEHTLAYAYAHASVCINARPASRIEKDENSDDPADAELVGQVSELTNTFRTQHRKTVWDTAAR